MVKGRYLFLNTFHALSVVHNGHIKRLTDCDIQSSVLEIMGTNVSTTYISAPEDAKQHLGIKLPFLVMIIKNVCYCRSWERGFSAEEVLLV